MLRPEGPVTIDSVEFLANKDVDKRLGKSSVSGMTGVGGDGLVCLVTGHGKIANRGTGGMPGTPPANQSQTPTPATTFAKAYWVFDIKTGNLLMMGGYGN